jgi:hypothetical protein
MPQHEEQGERYLAQRRKDAKERRNKNEAAETCEGHSAGYIDSFFFFPLRLVWSWKETFIVVVGLWVCGHHG